MHKNSTQFGPQKHKFLLYKWRNIFFVTLKAKKIFLLNMLGRIQMERKCTWEVKRWLYCAVIVNCILLCSLLNYYCCLLLEVNKNQLLQLTYNLIKHKLEKEISKNSFSSFCLLRSLKILFCFAFSNLFSFYFKISFITSIATALDFICYWLILVQFTFLHKFFLYLLIFLI